MLDQRNGKHRADEWPDPAAPRRAEGRERGLWQRVYRHLAEAIAKGELGAGAKIPAERHLMISFEAPRNAVRRALEKLEAEGLVSRRPGSGTFVKTGPGVGGTGSNGTPVSALDVLEVRLAIEPGFADLVVPRATNEDFERMDAALEIMKRCDRQRDFKEAGYLVNLEIVRATRNPLLIRVYELLIEARAKAGWETLGQLNDTPALRQEQIQALADFVDALRHRDVRKARAIRRRSNRRMISLVTGLAADTDD